MWSHAICETPLEHWTVAMEAFAVSMDDPYEAWHGERGDRIGLAFDLEWESEADAPQWSEPGVRYDVACRVNGDLQVGEESWTISVHGSRAHHWGEIAPTSVDRSDVSSGAAPFLLPGPTGARRLLRRLWPDDG